jgi:hypothetical protein
MHGLGPLQEVGWDCYVFTLWGQVPIKPKRCDAREGIGGRREKNFHLS